MLETGAAAAGAAVGAALASVERVAGPVAAEAAGVVGNILKEIACSCWYEYTTSRPCGVSV
eukprot:3025587-Pleurochrysis_carterae.AAC.2